MKQIDVAIIGAGAAGMMCALEARKRGRSVVLLDHAEKIGEKIRISGGGRCNFTNLDAKACRADFRDAFAPCGDDQRRAADFVISDGQRKAFIGFFDVGDRAFHLRMNIKQEQFGQ